ncbi:MAG: TIGR03118 family protein [Pyrinomonadaceae bacterium]
MLCSSKQKARSLISVSLSISLYVLMLPAASAVPGSTQAAARSGSARQEPAVPNIPVIPPGQAYRQTNFISDIPGLAPVQDPFLVNPWGISMTSTSPFWVANNGTSTTQLIKGDVPQPGPLPPTPVVLNASPQTITIPGGLPTGTVANGTTDFVIMENPCPAPPPCSAASGPARFLFASITGNITGWNPNVPAAGSTRAQIGANQPGHVYTGLAIGNNGVANFLYAADFANKKIDVFDKNFSLTTLTGTFADAAIPADYAPFNIQALAGKLYVTYAKVDPMTGRSLSGAGFGFVSTFDFNGNFLGRLISNGPLNAPWGVAIAPATFGGYGGALLVGNFGEGSPSINAFNSTTGVFLGTLQNEAGVGIVIDELWALQFGNGVSGGDPNTLYFTAGTAAEEHGLFGSLKPTTASATSLIQFATDGFVIGEGSGHIDITVTRAGDASGTATVNFNTFDKSQVGHASQKSDYEIALGKLTFNPGETSKTVRILLVDDNFVEGDEKVDLALSNPTGTGAGLGSPNMAVLRITDNDSSPTLTNPIDDAQFFVRQHYLDFLNREPDTSGLNFWVNQITSCGTDTTCREIRRINVSAAFFLSIEFQRTGMEVYLTHRAAFVPTTPSTPGPVLFGTFERDTQALQKDFVFGQPGADAQLEANTQAFFADFVTRPEFVSKYPGTLTNDQYVDNLLASAGLSPSNFVVNITNAQENPPTNPTSTGGARRPASYGTATFKINTMQDAMTFTATIKNLDFTGSQTADTNDNLTNAHIHAGAAVTPTTNGPVVWGFFGSPFNDNNPNDQAVTLLVGEVGGIISGKWDAPEGNGTTFAAQLANLKEGRAYINFHSTQFGGGEIRGNFPAMTAFRDLLVAGLNATTETRATVLRKVAESAYLNQREFNNAFVLMEYFGYLRRDADQAGFAFWLDKLNSFKGSFINAEMVKAFISSSEYRQRFGAN